MVPLSYDLHVFTEIDEADIVPGENVSFTIILENTGEVNNTYDITTLSIPEFWNVSCSRDNITLTPREDNRTLSKGSINILITAPENATSGRTEEVKIRVTSQNESTGTFNSFTPKETVTFTLHVMNPYDLQLETQDTELTVTHNRTGTSRIFLNNTGRYDLNVSMDYLVFGEELSHWNVTLSGNTTHIPAGKSSNVSLTISTDEEAKGNSLGITFSVFSNTPQGHIRKVIFIDVEYPEEESGGSR